MDPSKLKVVELRAELIARGLDSKGVKAILVERLRTVLDEGNGVASVPKEEPTTPTRVSRNKRTSSTAQSPSPVKENMNLDTSHDELTEEDDEDMKTSDPLAEQTDNQEQNTSIDSKDNEITMKDINKDLEPSIEEKNTITDTEIKLEVESIVDKKELPERKTSPILDTQIKLEIESIVDKKELPERNTSPILDTQIKLGVESIVDKKELSERKTSPTILNDDESKHGIATNYADEEEFEYADEEEDYEEEEEYVEEQDTKYYNDNLDEKKPFTLTITDSKINTNVNEIEESNNKTETETVPIKKEEHLDNDIEHNEILPQINKDQNVPETVNSIKDESMDTESIAEKSSSVKEEHKSESNHKRDDSSSNRKTRKRSRSDSSRDRRRSPSIIIPNTPAQNIDDFIQEEDEPDINNDILVLNWYDSDLHLKINTKDFLSAKPMSEAALGLAWAGVRGNHGVREGKVAYEVKITENNHVSNFPDEKNLHELRCGWSTLQSDLLIGENPLSFAYNGCGKKALDNKFENYGKSFGLNDIIGVYLDLDSTPCTIQFTVNGINQGEAFSFEKSTLEDNALFPHIATKNVGFAVNFGQLEQSMLLVLKPEESIIKTEISIKNEEKLKPDDETIKETDNESLKTETDETTLKENDKDKDEIESAPITEETREEEGDETKQSESNLEIDEDVEMKSEETVVKDETVEEVKQEPITKENCEKVQEDIVLYTILPDYEFISRLPQENYVKGPIRPQSREDCEVIMMIGLPGAGKTYWAGNWAKQHPEKMYNILGTNSLLERMKIFGQPRRTNHIGRWEKLIEWCSRSLIVLQDIACKRRRNYILDQTNVYPAAQRRKMKGFGHFKRIAVAVIPKEEDLKKRIEEKTEIEKKDIPDTAVNEMKANFAMPSSEFGWFDEVRYTDLEGDEALKEVIKYNEKGKKALPLPQNNPKRSRGSNYRDKRDEFKDRRTSRWGAAGDRRVPGGNERWRGPAGPPSRGWGGRDQGYGGGNSSGSGGGGGGGGGYDRRDRNWGNHGNWSQNRGPPQRSNYNNNDRNFRGSSNRMGQSSGSRDYNNRDRDQRRTSSRSSREREYRNSSESRDSRRSGNGYQRNGSGLKILKDVDNSRSSSQSNKNYSSTSSSQGQGNWGSSNNQNWGGGSGSSNQNQWSGYYGQNYNQNWGNYGNNSGWGTGTGSSGQWGSSGGNTGTSQQQTQQNSSGGGQWKNYGASSNTSSGNTNANVATSNVNSQNPQQQQQWYNWWHQQQTNSSNNGQQQQQQQQHQQQSATAGNQSSDPNAASTWQNWAQYYAGYNTGAPGTNPTKNSSTNNSADGSKK